MFEGVDDMWCTSQQFLVRKCFDVNCTFIYYLPHLHSGTYTHVSSLTSGCRGMYANEGFVRRSLRGHTLSYGTPTAPRAGQASNRPKRASSLRMHALLSLSRTLIHLLPVSTRPSDEGRFRHLRVRLPLQARLATTNSTELNRIAVFNTY